MFVARQAQANRDGSPLLGRLADKTMTEWLLSFANAAFGDEPVGQIAAPAILKVLQSLEARERYESARRLRSTIGSVFRYAIATARAETDPTYSLRGALAQVKSTPRAAITDPQRFGALLRAIDAFDGQPSTRIALQLLTLLFPRPGELRLAQWPEFDLQRALWTIPASRMKMRRAHRMALPCQALELLSSLRLISSGNFLFPGVRSSSRPISDGTLNAAPPGRSFSCALDRKSRRVLLARCGSVHRRAERDPPLSAATQ